MKAIAEFRIVKDKTPAKWEGEIYVEPPYKEMSLHIKSSKDSFKEALTDILSRYRYKKLKGLTLQRLKNKEE